MGCPFSLSSPASPTQCRAEGAIKFTEKLKKEGRGSSQALVLMAGTNVAPWFGAFFALATFNSYSGCRFIRLTPKREGDSMVNKEYCFPGGLGELEGSINFFTGKK